MFGWIQALMPREEPLFGLFRRHAATLVEGARALRVLLDGGEGMVQAFAAIVRHEDEADAITRDVLLAVRRTFITPFDRGDVQDLVTSLDDAIDQMLKTAKTINLFEVGRFEPQMREMADIIIQAATLTLEAVELLAAMRVNTARLNTIAVEIAAIEEKADALYDQGRKALYLAHQASGTLDFIIGVDIYSHLERVVDRFEDVANQISGIVIENV